MDQNKQVIANFLKPPGEGGAYTDERLAALLAHAEDGKLSFASCCCLIGIPTADHALMGRTSSFENFLDRHYFIAKYGRSSFEASQGSQPLPGMDEIESAFFWLGPDDETRRAKLIPLVKSEMQRRELLRVETGAREVVMA